MDLKRISLGARLLLAFLSISTILAVVGYVGITRIRSVARSGAAIYTRVTIPQGIIADLAIRYQQMRAFTIYYIKGTEASYLETQRKGIDARRQDIARGFEALEKAELSPEDRALVGQLKALLRKYYESQEKVFSLSRPDQYDERQLVFTGDAMKVSGEIQAIVDRLFERSLALARRTAEENAKTSRSATLAMTVLVVCGLLGSVGLGLLISRRVSAALDRIVSQLTEGADAVTSAASELSGTAQGMAEGSSEQAAALEETSSAMEEMSAMTRQNADNAGQAKALADRAGESVGKAGASMEMMVGKMGEISSKGEEVGKIIKTIDEIAFQTNLLALNAAVEAARAGEAGAGFAVVADEVRNLAQRAASSARSTSELLEGTIRNIHEGTMLVEAASGDFREVASAVSKVTGLVGEISAASSEQSRGITEVASAIAQMDKVTQSNAAGAEEIAASSEELSSQAGAMQDVVRAIRELVNGSGDEGVCAGAPAFPVPTRRRALTESRL